MWINSYHEYHARDFKEIFARIIMNISTDADYSVALQALGYWVGWEIVVERKNKAKTKVMYKVMNNMPGPSITQ